MSTKSNMLADQKDELSKQTAAAPVGIATIIDQMDALTPSLTNAADGVVTEKAGPAKAMASGPRQKTKPASNEPLKADIILKKLRSPRGVTIETLMQATGWQAHSVRGFLSANVRKKLGLTVMNEIGKDGVRRYRVDGRA